MRLNVIDNLNSKTGEKELPVQFSEDVRQDLIKRAVAVIQSRRRQSYGASPDAGKRASSILSKRRKAYRGMYGHGISRVRRKIMSRRGSRLNWVGAFSPGTVGGRRAHPPKAEKVLVKGINEKEGKKAIRSAISATVLKELVKKRGHVVPENYPFIVGGKIENLSKAKDVSSFLKKIGFEDELKRVAKKKIRAGKGKSRGRKYVRKRGLLMVVSKKSKLIDAAKNIPGLEVVEVKNLNAEVLAPGANVGRATLWSDAAINILDKERLFLK